MTLRKIVCTERQRGHEFNSVFFFFSSRRRHTRSKRDWSSDVCSSDLVDAGDGARCARGHDGGGEGRRSEEHTSELQSRFDLVCRLLLEKKKKKKNRMNTIHKSQRSINITHKNLIPLSNTLLCNTSITN